MRKIVIKLLPIFTIFMFGNTNFMSAQFLCDVDSRQVIYQTGVNEEYSGLAYSKANQVFLMPLDDVIGGYHIKGYDLSTNQPFNVGINGLTDDDLEGITYLEGNYFAIVEENKNSLYFYEYNNATKQLILKNEVLTNIPLGTNIDQDGLEGITYNPHTKRLFFVREHFGRELFTAKVTLPTNVSPGSIGAISSILLPEQYFNDPAYCNGVAQNKDASGLHHLGQNFDSNSPFANHMLILSEGNKKIVEFEIFVNASNTITLNYVGEEFILNEAQPEGITVVDNQIYIASERGCNLANVSLSSYSINGDLACANPCNPVLGCTNVAACNFNPLACSDDGSCIQTALKLKIYLEGAYNINTQQHTTKLNTERKLLPGQTPVNPIITPTPAGQPYNTEPWNYSGTEGIEFTDADYNVNDVDWVLVSLRSSKKVSDELFRVAGILQKEGTIRFLNDFCLPDPSITAYYIVVQHRNHLPVMSSSAIQMNNQDLVYDFTTQQSFTAAGLGAGQKQLDNGVWVAFAGNAQQISIYNDVYEEVDDIKGFDKALWFNLNGVFDQYLSSDMDLDGDLTGQDKTLWLSNNGNSSRVFHTN